MSLWDERSKEKTWPRLEEWGGNSDRIRLATVYRHLRLGKVWVMLWRSGAILLESTIVFQPTLTASAPLGTVTCRSGCRQTKRWVGMQQAVRTEQRKQ